MQSPLKNSGLVSPTTTRVPKHTPENLNRRILRRTRKEIEIYASDPARIGKRLAQLDREWDIERVLEANASSLVVLGALLGYLVSAWFYWIPLLVGGFLLQHAVQGWCPPIRLFRRIGFRTHAEIAREYYSLRALRGEFNDLPGPGTKPEDKAETIFRLLSWPPENDQTATAGPETDQHRRTV